MHPREAAFDHPPVCAQPATMSDAPTGNPWGDPTGAQQAPVRVVAVAPIGEHFPGLTTGAATETADWRDRLYQRQELGDVITVAAGEAHL
jgi:hypothetical protein